MQPNDINDPANVYSAVLVAVLITLVTISLIECGLSSTWL